MRWLVLALVAMAAVQLQTVSALELQKRYARQASAYEAICAARLHEAHEALRGQLPRHLQRRSGPLTPA